MKIKQNLSIIFFWIFTIYTAAQNPVLKIDLNVDEARKESEVNEPGYLAWKVEKNILTDTATFEGVRFVLSVVDSKESFLRGGWAKVMVQNPYYARLTCDGANIDYSSQTIEAGGKLLLEISGLPIGTHTIQTMHNSWQDPATKAPSPMNIYLDGVLVHDSIKISGRATKASEATTVMTLINVTTANQTNRLLFESVPNFTPPAGAAPYYNVFLNAIELNTIDLTKLAKNPFPEDAEMHADADSGYLKLSWSPASNNVIKHYIYVGNNREQVEKSDTTNKALLTGINVFNDTTYLLTNPNSLNTYYWRVDELDQNGVLTKGNVWSFRPRQLAFRGAEGYGRFATGGRGGKVVYVTNLNSTGPGSFHDAVTNGSGPRTVIFDVSGIITLSDKVFCDDYITIAGQTAPGKGICLRGNPLGIGDENICRFIRSRKGAGATSDGMGMTGSHHSITDHCSVSWTVDEAFSSRGAKYVTLQRSLISEALNCAGHKNYPEGAEHGYAATISGNIGSYHHNLLAHCNGRNWSIGDAIDGSNKWVSRLDIFNNVVYNWGSRTTDGEVHQLNFVNNYYKMGAASTKTTILRIDVLNFGWGTEQGYYSGNIIQKTDGSFLNNGSSNTIGREFTIGTGVSTPLSYEVYVDKPFFPSFAKIEKAQDAYKSVLSDVGCNLPIFDEHDQRIVRETMSGTYSFVGSKTGKKGLIDTEADAGGYEDYGNETRPDNYDTDRDGLPDWWEKLHGSNPKSAPGDFSDTNEDENKDGFTALDDFLEWMSVPHFYLTKNSSKSIDLYPFAISFTKSPQYSKVNSKDLNLTFTGSTVNIVPEKNISGIRYFDFKVSDADNSSMVRRIGVYVQEDSHTELNRISYKDIELKVCSSTINSIINISSESSKRKELTAELYDLTGRIVLKEQININPGKSQFQIKLKSDLPNEIYILEIFDRKTSKKYIVQKLIKK